MQGKKTAKKKKIRSSADFFNGRSAIRVMTSRNIYKIKLLSQWFLEHVRNKQLTFFVHCHGLNCSKSRTAIIFLPFVQHSGGIRKIAMSTPFAVVLLAPSFQSLVSGNLLHWIHPVHARGGLYVFHSSLL